jgi:alpha-amylase/alpha-mannosidase (GH57 family)
MSHPRYVCIHGHFYQPPRENPWLNAVEVEDSAAPFHDWNERITRECYAPNTRSRLLDGHGRIVQLLNNYAWMSFNFGPTLLQWMAEHAPDVHHGIVEADRLSCERRAGHGNALAQNYNHIIMPLAGRRDKETQVAWGTADFRHRFGRDPEGMWLAETGVDVETLEVMAEAGIRFTILAPRQAGRWRKLGAKAWEESPGGIDPSRPYLCRLPSGRTIVLFFYDAIVSHDVAFRRLLDDGERFLHRIFQGFDDHREHAQLMHIATDGESYGHHHPHGDMALAYVLERLGQHPDVRLTNYGEFLELHPPAWEVEIHENSSWSCAHGVERWRADCGCRFRGDWHQRWRGPLRQALDGLKEQLDHLFATRGRECFLDPWTARNAYIHVILAADSDRDRAVEAFLKKHGHPDLDESQVIDALRLLEMQQDAMLMFTSCGWFHDELSGIETVQCLQYAARAMHLARQFHRDFEPDFLAALQHAPSNVPRFHHGRGVWEQAVRPGMADLDRVLTHHAISRIFGSNNGESKGRLFAFDVETINPEVRSRGSGHLAVGGLTVRSIKTRNHARARFVVLHFGGLDFHAVLGPGPAEDEAFERFKARLFEVYRTGSLADVTALVAREFPGVAHRLDDLFRDEQRRIIGILLEDRVADYRRSFERLANQDEDLLNRLGQLNYPIPKPLLAAAATYLDGHIGDEIARIVRGETASAEAIERLRDRGRAWGYHPERDLLEKTLAESLLRTLEEIQPEADLAGITARAEQLLATSSVLGLAPDLWQAQNRFLSAYVHLAESGVMDGALHAMFVKLAVGLKVSEDLLGWRP